MKMFRLIVISILIFSLVSVQQAASASGQELPATREVPLTVKVVLIGFEEQWVDKDYFSWGYNTPSHRINNVWNWNNYLETGVSYKISYDVTFAPQSLKTALVDYLKSMGEKRTGVNRWFYYWDYSESDKMWVRLFHETNYVVYDAAKVEDWLYQHGGEYGGFPDNGWTIVLMYLPELPSFKAAQYEGYWENFGENVPPGVLTHYYGMGFTDADLGYKLRYRDFMTGYGGVHRFWFADLSAGPTWWSQWDDLPLNTILEDQEIKLDTPFGRQWLTQYLGDYTWEMVYNLVVPEFVYDPIYTSKYRLVVKVLDDRTSEEKSAVSIRSTVNQDMIKRAFEDLAPYASVEVDLQFEDTAAHPQLQQLLKDNRRFYNSYIIRDLFSDKYEYIDERPIYKYLQDNLDSLVPGILGDETELTVPMFVFALSGDAHFGYSYKWEVGSDPDRTYGGVALGDLVMIGQSHMDFTWGDYVGQKGKGIGLTQVVIHEAGHMIGLSHPHTYGALQDFSLGAMGYFTHDYVFGQNDKDALQRIHADKIVLETSSIMRDARIVLQSKIDSPDTKGLLDRAENLLRDIDSEYSKMNYASAVGKALEARKSAKEALANAKDLPDATVPLEENVQSLEQEKHSLQRELENARSMSAIYVIVGVVVGIAIGCAIMWFVLKRRSTVPSPSERVSTS